MFSGGPLAQSTSITCVSPVSAARFRAFLARTCALDIYSDHSIFPESRPRVDQLSVIGGFPREDSEDRLAREKEKFVARRGMNYLTARHVV